ncbi:unnamed protein product [Oppiella nova]|uniref:Uncharacterized protein n=1 Tax=Oppiella nova TaxID=334625 RepID=A0A7R9LN27_9ACAR|nr:unnamed protein product [Oppiella nova]CAG2164662.1 unnamed protein product [Oppiella nova]
MNQMEVMLNWFVWTSSLGFALYSFISDSKYLIELIDAKDVTKGWLLDGPQDVSDYEWNAIRHTFRQHFIHIIIYLVLTQLFIKYKIKMEVMLNWFVWTSSLGFALYSFISDSKYLIELIDAKDVTKGWLLDGPQDVDKQKCNISQVLGKQRYFRRLELNETQLFLFEVCMAWLNAKCLSLSIDRIRSQIHRTFYFTQLIQCVAYCLYLPAFFTGPIHQYNTFISDMNTLEWKWTSNRVMEVMKQLLRFTFWSFVFELMLHLVFSQSIQFYPELTQMLSVWSLCGLGFALPLMFFVKYFIIYGSVATIAAIDGFRMPVPPKCISRIHSCVYLWRTFDRGLHLWLTNYFYKPIIGTQWNPMRKVFAGFVCFLCICLWHGMDRAVVVWTSLNFFGVSAEIIAKSIHSSNHWSFVTSNLSSEGNTRLNALIACPFFAIAYASNIFFLSNWDVGYYFVKTLLLSFPTPLLPTLLVMYFGCHVSIHCMRSETTT